MNISFKGLENLSAHKSENTKSPLYFQRIYTLSGSLTNDLKGNDKDSFYKALKRAGSEYEWHCFPKTGEMLEDTFSINILQTNVRAPGAPQINEFFLNNYKLQIHDDKALPLFSFIGKTMLKMKEAVTNEIMKKNISASHKILMKEIMEIMRV